MTDPLKPSYPRPGRTSVARLLSDHGLCVNAEFLHRGVRFRLERIEGALRRAVTEAVSRDADAGSGPRRRLRTAIRRAAEPRCDDGRAADILRDALPEAFTEVGRALAGIARPMVLGSDAARRLGTAHVRLVACVEAGIFTEEALHQGGYRRAQYVESEIEEAAAAHRGSIPWNTAAFRLGLPTYAVEQLVEAGLLAWERHPFVLATTDQPRIVTETFADFCKSLKGSMRDCRIPADAVKPHAALRIIGGRPKPWSRLLNAVSAGSIEAWSVDGSAPLIQRMRVRSADVGVEFGLDEPSKLTQTRRLGIPQVDAVSLLNLNQAVGPALINSGLIGIERRRDVILFDPTSVLALGSRHVATAEAAARLGCRPAQAHRTVIRALGEPSTIAGWSRQHFDESFGW